MKLRLHPPIPHPINLQLKTQPRTINNHLERKIQVIKLHAPRGRQTREQTPRHGVEVRRQRAHVYQVACVRHRRLVRVAGDEVVCYDEGLSRSEVARVVECDGA